MSNEMFNNQLMKYLYHEMGNAERSAAFRKIDADATIAEELYSLMQTKNRLDELELSPKQSTLDNIMAYARAANSSTVKSS